MPPHKQGIFFSHRPLKKHVQKLQNGRRLFVKHEKCGIFPVKSEINCGKLWLFVDVFDDVVHGRFQRHVCCKLVFHFFDRIDHGGVVLIGKLCADRA